MPSFGEVLAGLGDGLGKFLGANSSAQAAAQQSLAQQAAIARQQELSAVNTQTTVKFAALGVALLLGIVLLARNKTL